MKENPDIKCAEVLDNQDITLPFINLEDATRAIRHSASFSTFLRKSSTTPDEFIVNCAFGDESPVSCRQNWTVVETIFGRCFFLNLTGFNVSRAGIDYAVQVEFDAVGFDAPFQVDSGLMLSLIPPGRPPIVMEPIELNPGYNVHLPLRYVEEEYHESACTDKDLRVTPKYYRSACMLQSFLERAEKKCGCIPNSGINIGDATCSVSSELGCVRELRENSSNVWSTEACKVGCFEPKYESSMSYSTNDAEKSSKNLENGDVMPKDKYILRDYLQSVKNGTDKDLYPQYTMYGQIWRNRTKDMVTESYRVSAKDSVRFSRNLPYTETANEYRSRIFFDVWYPLKDFVYQNLLLNLISHGSEYGVWPMLRQNGRSAQAFLNMTRCHIKDFIFPIPTVYARSYTAYMITNELMTYKTKIKGLHETGKAGIVRGTAVEYIDPLIEALNDSVQLGKKRSKPDTLAEQLLERAIPYRACLFDEDNKCATATLDGAPDIPCRTKCQTELDRLAYGLEAVVQIRDVSFLFSQYQRDVNGALNLFSKFSEGAMRPYEVEFLEGLRGWEGFYGHSEVEHARWMLDNWPSWQAYINDFKDRANGLYNLLEQNIVPVTDPTNLKIIFETANLTLPDDYNQFFESHECAKYYRDLWNVSTTNWAFKTEYREASEVVYRDAQTFMERSNVGPEYFRENVMSATIYLAQMMTKKMDQRLAYDFWSMLSDIGGTISFYIGGTLITVFEIIFMCTNCHRRRHLRLRAKEKQQASIAKLTAVMAFREAPKNKKAKAAEAARVAAAETPSEPESPPTTNSSSPSPVVPNKVGSALIRKLKENPEIAEEARAVAAAAQRAPVYDLNGDILKPTTLTIGS